MQSIQSSVSLVEYQQNLVSVLQSDDSVVFLDTNLLAWGFRLNNAASQEFTQWLEDLAKYEQLIIPAWTVHEYNHHLLRDDPAFFLPHKSIGKQLDANLTELEKYAHLMISDESADRIGFTNRQTLLSALSEASNTIKKCSAHLTKNDVQRRRKLIEFLATLIDKCALKSNVHELADAAAREAPARYANRLSPGYNDAEKPENAWGDFIVWKELLSHCKTKGIMKAVLITNDRKPDWVYTPLSVVLTNGSAVSGTNEKARLVKLPKPDLIAEFEYHTASTQLHIFSIESVIEALSSSELNHRNAQDFRQLALAIKLDLARTPTEAVIQWFLKNTDKYEEATHGVCRWEQSPSEVNMSMFVDWTVENMKKIDANDVDWMVVFCDLFL